MFDVYMDWHHIRQEAYAAVLNIDLYELAPPPHYTPAVPWTIEFKQHFFK